MNIENQSVSLLDWVGAVRGSHLFLYLITKKNIYEGC
jgi:hypothetical protein